MLEALRTAISREGGVIEGIEDDGRIRVSVVATYEGVIAAQEELDELSAPVGGKSDGWGTFGNLQ